MKIVEEHAATKPAVTSLVSAKFGSEGRLSRLDVPKSTVGIDTLTNANHDWNMKPTPE